jgi:outer membrane protein TolC
LDLEFKYGSNDPFSIDGSDPGASSVDGNWSALLRLSIPWTFRAERAKVKIAQAELEGSEIAREKGLRDLRRLCHETCREIESGREQHHAAATALAVNEAKWEEQQSRHREGFATARDLTEAEAELRMAEARELEARLRIVLAKTLLARLDGTIAERHGLIL